MIRDVRHLASLYETAIPSQQIGSNVRTGPVTPGDSQSINSDVPNQSNEEKKEIDPKQVTKAIKDWIRLEPGLYPIDTVRKADHTAHVILQFIYSICASPDAVHRVIKTVNKAYKQDHK